MVKIYEKEVFAGTTLGADDYRRVLVAIHKAVNDLAFRAILLNFSECTVVYPNGILPIIAYVRELAKSKIDFSIVLPRDEKLAKLFKNANWAYLLEPRSYHEARYNPRQSNLPTLTFTSDGEQQDCVNKILDSIMSTIPSLNRADFASVEWALNEITDNVLNHASAPTGGILQLTMHHNRRRAIEFTVCDGGLGVARTLRESRPEISSDLDALTEAIKEGVTRNLKTNQGNGLFGSFEIARISGGNFKLHSNFARLELSHKTVVYKDEKVPLSGTMVDVTIDLTDPGVLEQALKFKGLPHRPVDLIEFRYETADLNSIHFILHDEVTSFASRLSGKHVRIKLNNLFTMCNGVKIILDFSGLSVISSSFADEVFGMLFKELGPMQFMASFAFTNISPTIAGLIDRAIKLRAQQ